MGGYLKGVASVGEAGTTVQAWNGTLLLAADTAGERRVVTDDGWRATGVDGLRGGSMREQEKEG